MKEASALAKQVLIEDLSALAWKAPDNPHLLTEAAVSSYRQQQKLAGLSLTHSYVKIPDSAWNNSQQLASPFYSSL